MHFIEQQKELVQYKFYTQQEADASHLYQSLPVRIVLVCDCCYFCSPVAATATTLEDINVQDDDDDDDDERNSSLLQNADVLYDPFTNVCVAALRVGTCALMIHHGGFL